MVAAACDLRPDVSAADFCSSLRAGTIALQAAIDAVDAGSAKRVVVVAADCRLGLSRSEFEYLLGDGAAALVVGDTDYWRRDKDYFVRGWEDRFIITHGYTEHVQKVVARTLQKYGLTPKDFARLVLYGSEPRTQASVARSLGFDLKTQVQDPLFGNVGNTGAAHAPMLLVAALEWARPGDRLLLVSYGDGAEAYVLKVGDQIAKAKGGRGVKGHLEPKLMLKSYEKYVRFRQLIEGSSPGQEGASLPAL